MLTNLTISGFKSIRQKTVIEFGRANLFIGGNGVGKSNVLEAIGILSACFGADISANELEKKGVRLSVPTLFKSAFKNHAFRSNFDLSASWDNGIKYDASISAGNASDELNFFSEHLLLNNEKIYGRSNHGFSIKGGVDKRLIQDLKKTRGLWDRFQDIILPSELGLLEGELNAISKFAIYSPQTSFLRGSEIESKQIRPIGLLGGGLAVAANAVMHLLNEYKKDTPDKGRLFQEVFNIVWAPGWANTIKVSRNDPSIVSSQVKTRDATLYFRDKYMNTRRSYLSAYDSSEGTLYLLFVAALLLHPESPKIFAFDNVDNALNPSITRKLLETIIKVTCDDRYRSNNIGPEQVFFTSHNPTSLDAFDIFDKNQRVFVVMRDEQDGSTTVTPLVPPKNMTRDEWTKNAGGKSLSELWIENKIKGALGI